MSENRSVTVFLRANVNDFQREMAKATTPLDQLVKKSGDASGEASTFMGKLAQSARLQSAEWRTAGASLVTYGAGMTGLLTAVAKTGIEYNTLQQTSRAALTTILDGSQQANAQMDKLDEFARTSPFSKAVFIEAQQQMLGFGIEAQKVIPYLDAIQDAVAATGGSNQDIAELSRIFSQVSSSAKITATDLMQFGQRGVDAAALIGSQMGMTAGEIRESITAGTLDAGEALDALAAGMSERFGGAAANVKDTMTGAFDRVKAAWRDLSASIMSSAVDPDGGGWLVGLTNGVADLIRMLDRLPDPILQTTAGIGAVTGASALAVGGLMVMLPKLLELQTAWSSLAQTWPGVVSVIGKLGPVAVVAGTALAALAAILGPTVDWHQRARKAVEDYSDVLSDNTGELDSNTAAQNENVRMAVAKRLQDEGLLDIASTLGVTLSDVTDAVLGEADAYQRVQSASQDYVGGIEALIATKQAELDQLDAAGQLTDEQAARYNDLTNEIELLNGEASIATGLQRDLASAIGGESGRFQEGVEQARALKEEQEQLAEAAEGAVDPTKQLGDAVGTFGSETPAAADGAQALADGMHDAANAARDQEEAQRAVTDAINGYYDAAISAANAAIGLERSIDKASEAAKENGRTLDISTEAGRKNREALLDLAQASMRNAEEMLNSGASTDEATAATQRARDEFVRVAQQMGMTSDQAAAYADELGLIPDDVGTWVHVEGDAEARRKAQWVRDEINKLPPEKRTQFIAQLRRGDYTSVEAQLNALARQRTVVYNIRATGANPRAINLPQSDGGVVDYYAGGGLRESHVAQIAPAGAWRIWAEPETGGEAYIPLAPSKRARSMEIWRETGSRLGVPREWLEAARFNDGGFAYSRTSVQRPASVTASVDPGVISAAVARGLEGARIVMDGRVIDARIETAHSRTARRVQRGG